MIGLVKSGANFKRDLHLDCLIEMIKCYDKNYF